MSDTRLREGVVAGIPVRTVLRDGEIVLCLASHAVEIPLCLEDADNLGTMLIESVRSALLLGVRDSEEALPHP